MNLGENLRLAWESLNNNRMRAVLTMLGIIIGVGSVIAVVAIGRGTRSAVLDEFSVISSNSFQMVAMPPEGGGAGQKYELFTDDDLRALKSGLSSVQDIAVVTGWRAEARSGAKTKWVDLTGTPYSYTKMVRMEIGSGRFYTASEESQAARVLVLGPEVAKEFFGDRSPVGQVIYVGGYPFRVIGVFATDTGMLARMFGGGTDRLWATPLSTVRRITGVKEFQTLVAEVKPGASVQEAMEDAKAIMKRRKPGGNFVGFTMQQITDVIGNVANMLTGVIGAIAGISLLVGGVGIMNIMLVSVTERTREIGIRKAIGATRADILSQFLIEAVVVSLSGGLIGTGLAALPVWVVGRWMKLPLLVSWDSIVLALGFSVAVGVLFGVYPASKAAAKDPIDALRYE